MKLIFISGIFVLLMSFGTLAQNQLSLEDCYQLVNKNYPLAKQLSLLKNQNTYDLDAIKAQALPQLNLAAQATYQSEVTQIPIPTMSIEPLNNNQYRATANINQLIYNGNRIELTLNAQKTNLKTQQKQVEVSLYQLKKQVNQIYFSILLLQEKNALLLAKQKQLTARIKEVRSGIEYGTVLPVSDKVLEAELIKLKQQLLDITYNKNSLFETLSLLTGSDFNTNTTLENPELQAPLQTGIFRPELELFQLKKEQIQANEQLLSKNNYPKLSGFATGGYGNPGLNMLDNSFQGFYTVGLQLNWKVFDWNSNKRERQSLLVKTNIIDNETEVFNLKTNMKLRQQESDMQKINKLIATDTQIINLRQAILKASESQLKNGVITASAYITELTNLFEDETLLKTHKIQLLLVKANYNITKGQ